ncbi:replication terminator protein [Macrococcoides caseolyticum]|uniref:replication terminator protein n=1 Tax=Macrococcoides caseolyticum TaxID=69966 RepID=UPI001F266E63|nr:replication terminator protein [Macrococcus caseolyticus]MCE4957693.1 replication terminator protein [Macrococcus caseolyticus]
MAKIDLSKLADGAVQERFEDAFNKALENIHDLNTDPKKTRKVTLEVKISSDENRELLFMDVSAKTSLQSRTPIGVTMMTGVDSKGNPEATELKSGAKDQTYFDDNGTVRQDDGKPIENNKVTEITKKQLLK